VEALLEEEHRRHPDSGMAALSGLG